MATEYEAKILDVDPAKLSETIAARGGHQVGETVLQRRYVYDIATGDESRWLRLRENATGVTLAVKEVRHGGIDGTDEVEVGVDGFDTTNELLGKLGFIPRSYQENRRTSFALDGARLEVDEWPWISPYLEVEADSRAEVLRLAARLGFTETDLTGENTVSVYARHGIDLRRVARVRFADPPPARPARLSEV